MRWSALVAVALTPVVLQAQSKPASAAPPKPSTAITQISLHAVCSADSGLRLNVTPWSARFLTTDTVGFEWVVDAATDTSITISVKPDVPIQWPYQGSLTGPIGKAKKKSSGKMKKNPKLGRAGYTVMLACSINGVPVKADIDPDVTIDPVLLPKGAPKKAGSN